MNYNVKNEASTKARAYSTTISKKATLVDSLPNIYKLAKFSKDKGFETELEKKKDIKMALHSPV